MSKPTLRDVAVACGVDVSTVSRALRDDPRVARQTGLAVRAAAERLGYRPNLAAQALQAGATRTVWVLVGSFSNAIDRCLAEHAEAVLGTAGYDVLVAIHRGDDARYERLLQRLDQGLADGALVIPGLGVHPDSPTLRRMLERRWPLVFCDRYPDWAGVPIVTTDNAGATVELIRRLHAAGARRLVIAESGSNMVAAERRQVAFRVAAAMGMPAIAGRDVAASWFAATAGPIGVFASEQRVVLDWCRMHADALPADGLRFACFDSWEGEPYPAPLAIVAEQDFAGIASRAVGRILAAIGGQTAHEPAVECLPPLGIHEVSARL